MRAFTTTLTFLLVISSSFCWGEMILIVHPKSEIQELSKKEVKNIFLGKKTQTSTGQAVFPVTLKPKESLTEFTSSYLNKSHSQFLTYWKRILYAGRGHPPRSFESPSELIEFIAQDESALGFIDESDLSEKVRKVKVN